MPLDIEAAVLRAAGSPIEVETVTLDDPAADEVRVRTVGSGLCHSDLHVIDGTLPSPLPAVLGHEVAGVVVEVGSQVRGLAVGDHVISCVSTYCGRCRACVGGRPWLCAQRFEPGIRRQDQSKLSSGGAPVAGIGGMSGFAEQIVMHQSGVVAIDPDMPLDLAALIGCAVVTGVGTAINEARIRPGETCAVIGCGGIGLNVVQGAKLAGAARIIAVDLQPAKRELATRFGATDVVNPGDGDPIEAVRALTEGLGVDHAFEAIGLKVTAEQAVAMVGPGGGAYLIGVMPVGVNIEIPGVDLVVSGVGIHGVRMGSSSIAEDFPRFVELYQQGRLLLDELVAERITLHEINEGYDKMRVGDQGRSVIVFEDAATG